MLKSLPFSQLLRVKRIVHDPDLSEQRLRDMGYKFIKRGYPRELIDKHIKKVKTVDRKDLLRPKITKTPIPRLAFVSTFSDLSERVGSIIKKEWHILKENLSDIPEFKIPPIMAYRRPQNLKDKLVTTDIGAKLGDTQRYIGSKRNGCFPCLQCSNCANLIKREEFIHPTTGRTYKIKHFLTCKSEYVIYVIQCPCNKLYVGETTMQCRQRMNNHKSTIRTQKVELPVAQHFLEKGHNLNELRFSIVDHIPRQRRGGDRKLMLKKRELEWIFKLNTLEPTGLNQEFRVLPGM